MASAKRLIFSALTCVGSVKVRWNRPAPVFPEVNAREVAETRIGERRKNRMGEINLTKQRVIAGRLADLEVGRACEGRDSHAGLRARQNQ